MRSHALGVALFAAHISLASAAVKLKLTDNMKLPAEYAGNKFDGAKTYKYDKNVGEKNAIMDTFVFVVGETKLLQVCRVCDLHVLIDCNVLDL